MTQSSQAARGRFRRLEEHVFDTRECLDFSNRSADALEDRVAAIERLLTVPWPRSILARHRLRRQLLGSVAGYPPEVGTDFGELRAQWMGEQIHMPGDPPVHSRREP